MTNGVKQLFNGSASIIRELPYGKGVSIGIDTISPYLVKDTIICIDDFERQASIEVEDILGLINELKEEKGCKVALIFNDEKLEKKDVYRAFKEKVVDFEMLYAPTVIEAFDLVFPVDFPDRAKAVEHISDLKITNIRILRKTREILKRVLAASENMHHGVQTQIIAATILFCWCAYAPDEKKPNLRDIAHWNSALYSAGFNKAVPVDPIKTAWTGMLYAYGFYHVNDMDLALARVVESGYLVETGFIEEVKKLDKSLRDGDQANELRKVWRQFHDSFTGDTEEFINQLYLAAINSMEHIGINDLDATVSLLRTLKRDDLAEKVIAAYVDAHKDQPKLFDLSQHPFGGSLSDPKLREALGIAHGELVQNPTLAESVLYMVNHSGWNTNHIEAMKRATVDDYRIFFQENHGEMHSQVVKRCLQFVDPENGEIVQKAREALVFIGNTSELNAARVKNFGL